MAHFARLNSNNIVETVIVVTDSDSGGGTLATESVGITFCKNHVNDDSSIWKQTSYNKNFRGNYAGIGMTYMSNVATMGVGSTDIFVHQQPYPSWSIGINTARWYPPDNPGHPPALSSSEIAASKSYRWNEGNYQADPSTAWELTTPTIIA